MRFDTASDVEQTVWDMRLSEQVRAEDRKTLLRLFDGFPPFDETTAEENNIQVNLNDLSGPNVLFDACRQWNNAHLRSANFFVARADSGTPHKRQEWSQTVTKEANRLLKRSRAMSGQSRATGKNTLLFGIGPTNWPTRRGVVCKPVPVGSLLIPSETEIEDLNDNLSYLAIFREYNAEQLYDMTHGPHVDPGWNMPLVEAQWQYIKDELRKSPNSIAYQYMPERIEQLEKQDKGYLGTDAAPTVDVWDFYFRQAENGKGWYRRIIVDWYVGDQMASYAKSKAMPESRNRIKGDTQFLYTSGKRRYADSLEEILHCNFGDCSAYAPVKYHSLRGLGWMLWGVCDLQNRLHCKFNEAVFEQLMWFFQTAGNTDLIRLKKANFEHMGVIPQGIKFLTANERYTPNWPLIEGAFARNRQQLADASMSYTQGYDEGSSTSPETATAVMAKVNSAQALASGILESSYEQEKFKYREMLRRLMLKHSNDPMAREFRKQVLRADVPEEMLDVEKWEVEPERVLGGGNKTVQMATIGFLNQIRKNMPPMGQRLIDNISVSTATDQPDLAEEIAPLGEDHPISNSTHDAQEATMRLLAGLPFSPPKDAIFEDYVVVWLHDLGLTIQRILQKGIPTPEELNGMLNLGRHVGIFLGIMAKEAEGATGDQDTKEKLRQYEDALNQLLNHIKALGQRMQQAMKAQAGQAGAQGDGKDAAKVQAMLIQAQTKAAIADRASQQRTRQKEEHFQKEERRKDQQAQADLLREGVRTRHELMANRLKALAE